MEVICYYKRSQTQSLHHLRTIYAKRTWCTSTAQSRGKGRILLEYMNDKVTQHRIRMAETKNGKPSYDWPIPSERIFWFQKTEKNEWNGLFFRNSSWIIACVSSTMAWEKRTAYSQAFYIVFEIEIHSLYRISKMIESKIKCT
jgi:hypothetical protein